MNLSRKNNKNINKRSSKKLNKKSSKKSITKSSKKKVNKILSKKITKKLSKKLNGRSPGRRTLRNSVAVKTGGNPNITELENQIKSLKNQVTNELEKNMRLRLENLRIKRKLKLCQGEELSNINEEKQLLNDLEKDLNSEKKCNISFNTRIRAIQALIEEGVRLFNMNPELGKQYKDLKSMKKVLEKWKNAEESYHQTYHDRLSRNNVKLYRDMINALDTFQKRDDSLKDLITRMNQLNQQPTVGQIHNKYSVPDATPTTSVVQLQDLDEVELQMEKPNRYSFPFRLFRSQRKIAPQTDRPETVRPRTVRPETVFLEPIMGQLLSEEVEEYSSDNSSE